MTEGPANAGPSSPTPAERWEALKAESDLWPADRAVIEMIEAAVLAEREACAKLAETVSAEWFGQRKAGDLARNWFGGGAEAGREIASAIRTRT